MVGNDELAETISAALSVSERGPASPVVRIAAARVVEYMVRVGLVVARRRRPGRAAGARVHHDRGRLGLLPLHDGGADLLLVPTLETGARMLPAPALPAHMASATWWT